MSSVRIGYVETFKEAEAAIAFMSADKTTSIDFLMSTNRSCVATTIYKLLQVSIIITIIVIIIIIIYFSDILRKCTCSGFRHYLTTPSDPLTRIIHDL